VIAVFLNGFFLEKVVKSQLDDFLDELELDYPGGFSEIRWIRDSVQITAKNPF
jgi:hypothetical protein